jgi:hypothetical protein
MSLKIGNFAVGMKMNFNIGAMMVAALIVMLLPFVHHHHHNGMACMTVEHCEDDGSDNDEHTSHHDDHTFCSAESSYFLTKSVDRNAAHQFSQQMLLGVLVALLPDSSTDLHSVKFEYNHSELRCDSQWIANSLGLRAPPIMICNA